MLDFYVSTFQELPPEEIYNIYRLRAEVFVVEQNCVYQDPDLKDPVSFHVQLYEGSELAAYCRLVPGINDEVLPSIGRVVVAKSFRGKGLGVELMQFSLNKALYLFNTEQIVISAQCYLLQFYTDLGFEAEGGQYLEDNIPHIKMKYRRQ